jgi:hypothetical protein
MGYSYGPSIVKNGMVLCLDAGNRKSYAGSGTSWFDLTGNNITGTLTNGPTFNSENGGSISFDGTNDHILINANSIFNVTAVTILMFIKTPTTYTSNFRAFFGKQTANSLDRDFNFYAYSSTSNGVIDRLHMSSHRISSYEYVPVVTGGALALNTWHQIGFSIGGGYVTYYLNGTAFNKSTYTGTFNANNSYNITIGTADNYWSGRIATTMLYNRAVSDAEVLQNYNATKGRFGL